MQLFLWETGFGWPFFTGETERMCEVDEREEREERCEGGKKSVVEKEMEGGTWVRREREAEVTRDCQK